jgi:hypothetical protein
MSPPLVSCIMPTANRREFVARAVEYYLRQDYEHSELVVVDDGDDAVADLMPRDGRVRYVRLDEKLLIGAKRNRACEEARGDIIAHWDDDDWSAPHRLRYQIGELLRSGAQVCGINRLLFYDVRDGRGWQYNYPASQRLWLSGSSLCYRREFWASNRFASVDVGEDARFVWAGRPEQMHVLPDETFHVGIIHDGNVSPKRTGGAYWSAYNATEIRKLFGSDWPLYAPGREREAGDATRDSRPPEARRDDSGSGVEASAARVRLRAAHTSRAARGRARPVSNVFACLVHESRECVVDLVRNLRFHDPSSVILLYNGGPDRALLDYGFPFERYGAVVCGESRPMRWGWLHGFALDCMRFALANFSFDTLTVVDSDQVALRPGYSSHLRPSLGPRVGMLGNSPSVQDRHTRISPAAQAWREFELWRPLLRRFERGEEKYVHWTFWPSTVFTADASRALVRLFNVDEELRGIMSRSQIWATEEVILPTLVSLLGFDIAHNPCSYDYVKYRHHYSLRQLDEALARPDAFWMHPVARRYDDALRRRVRERCNQYERQPSPCVTLPESAAPEGERLFLSWPIIREMREIEGWLEDEEAELLIAATARSLESLPAPHALVEVGSYCGRATVLMGRVAQRLAPEAKIYAVDPHDGRVGALDTGLQHRGPTLERFKRNLAAADLSGMVEIVQRTTAELTWREPVTLLLVDGLHDYANVACDFFRFDALIRTGGFVAFHDYADYYPGVQTFVNELLAAERYRLVGQAGSMIILRKAQEGSLESPRAGD